jgi:hypothetical protein
MRSLAEFLDHELDGAAHQAVGHHLELCRSCFSRAEFEQRLKAEIRRVRKAEVSAGFEARVRQLLDSFPPSTEEPADRS